MNPEKNLTSASNRNATNDEELALAETVIFSSVFSLISVAGLIGNMLVIVAITGDSKMRKSAMNVLLLNLALADICNVIACIPEFVFQLINRGWLIPYLFCPLMRFLERVFLYTSLLTQLAVGIERFYAIAYPMKVRLLCSRRKVTWWAFFLWLVSMSASSPYGIWSSVRHGDCRWGGGLHTRTRLTLQFAECLLFYFVPLVLIVVLYSVVSATLWSRHNHLHEGRTDSGPQETLKTRKSVVKMLIVCVCVYFICYSPIQAIVLSAILFGRPMNFSMSVRLALHCLAYSCSAANPIVYTFYSHRFRRKFAELLCCKGKYERVSSTAPASLALALNHLPSLGRNSLADGAAVPYRNGRLSSDATMVSPRTKLLAATEADTYAGTADPESR